MTDTGAADHDRSKRHLGRAMFGGMAGTAVMTIAARQLSRALHADQIDHADFLAALTHSTKAVGEIEHYALGGVLMPLAYSQISPHLRGPRLVRGLEWGALLWLAAEASLSPAVGKGIFASRSQTPGRTLLTSLAGHLAYGIAEAAIAG